MAGSIKDTWVDDGDAPAPGPAPATTYVPTGRVLGEGGLGRVDEVRDERLGRSVARKQLLADTPAMRERFLREARVTAQLEHPGIVPIYALETDSDGRPFYTMRRIEGRNLGEVLRDTPDLRQRLALLPAVVQACQAVAYAHARGVVHRDLKPDNVMLGPFGETVVVDWGLAKVTGDADGEIDPVTEDGPASTTRAGAVLGSPAYMSPEQARGEEADARSDVWGLGTMLFEVLAGRPPFDREAASSALDRLRRGEFEDLRTVLADAPPELAAVVGRALEPSVERRYPDATALAADLVAWQAGEAVAAYDYSLGELVRKTVRRHRVPLVVGAVATALLLVVLGGSVGAWRQERDRALAAEAEARAGQAAAELALARVEVERGDQQAADERLDRAQRLLVALGRSTEAVDRVRAWGRFLNAPPLLELLLDGTPQAQVLSPDARTLLVVQGDRVVRYSVPDGARVDELAPGGAGALTPKFAEDGRAFVMVSDGEHRLLDYPSGRERLRLPGTLVSPTVHVRGDRVWVSALGAGTRPWDLDTGQPLGPAIPGADVIRFVSDDGSRLMGYSSTVDDAHRQPDRSIVWDSATGRELLVFDGSTDLGLSPSGVRAVASVRGVHLQGTDGTDWRREIEGLDGVSLVDDEVVFVIRRDGTIQRFDAANGEPLGPPIAFQGRVNSVSRDELLLRLPGRSQIRRIQDRPPTPARLDEQSVVEVAVSRDEQLLASVGWSGRLRVTDWRSGLVLRDLDLGCEIGARGVEWSPDGARLATADRCGRVQVWDPVAGTRALSVDHPTLALSARWADDGATLVAAYTDGAIAEWSAADGRALREHRLALTGWSFEVLGDRLFVSGRDPWSPSWALVDRATGELRASAGAPDAGFGLDVSPDGRWGAVATYRGAVELVDLHDGTAFPVTLGSQPLMDVAFDPTGERLAAMSIDGVLTWIDVPGRAVLDVFPLHGGLGATAVAAARGAVLSTNERGELVVFEMGPGPAPAAPGDVGPRALELARVSRRLGDDMGAAAWLDRALAAGESPPASERLRLLARAGRTAEVAEVLDAAAAEGWDATTTALWRGWSAR